MKPSLPEPCQPMNLSIRRLRPSDLPACADLVLHGPSVPATLPGKGLRSSLFDLWNALMRAGSGVAGVIEEERQGGRRVVGFGMFVFVSDGFVRDAEQGSLPPYVLHCLTEQRARRGPLPVLPVKDVERANRAGGLNFLGLHTEFGEGVLSEGECLLVRDELFRCFSAFVRGYNLRYWMKEVYGAEERDRFVLRFGCRVLSDYGPAFSAGRAPRPAEARRPYLLGLGEAEALHPSREHYVVREMFLKNWPRYGFSEGERTLLHAALEGVARQEDQADVLYVSLAAIKKRWEGIYRKAAERDAALPPGMDLPPHEQPVNHVLNYVRRHLEEIRPAFFPWQ